MSGVLGQVHACSWALVLAVALFGCGEPDEIVVREGEQTEAFCDANCTRDAQCGGRTPLGACKASCEAGVTGLENLRPEGVKIAVECILELPCSRFYDDEAFVPCWERAEREIEPNESVRRFCRSWSTRWFECGSSYSVDQCESDWAINSAGYLERMSACIERSCGALDACAEAVRAGGGG